MQTPSPPFPPLRYRLNNLPPGQIHLEDCLPTCLHHYVRLDTLTNTIAAFGLCCCPLALAFLDLWDKVRVSLCWVG
jgi:hypothetical protein